MEIMGAGVGKQREKRLVICMQMNILSFVKEY